MKASRQPQVTDSQTTSGGATMAPIEVPVVNHPVAMERCQMGNQMAAVLAPAGMAAASLTPKQAAEEGHGLPAAGQGVQHAGDASGKGE